MDAFILNLLNSPAFQNIVDMFLVPLAVNSVSERLKALKTAIKDKTHEEQLLDCLEKAFFETERAFHWKHDYEAIYDSFFGILMSFSDSFNQATLEKIFRDAVGADVTDRQIALWVDNVKKQISLEEHTKLREYLLVCHIMQDQTPQSESIAKYILTSSASIYDNPEIICRDAFIDDLLQLLSSGHKRIQITGMGGLGKTETLTKLFAKLAAQKKHSGFDHIAFIRFSGDIASDIESQIDYPREYLGFNSIEAAKRFLHDICAEKNVLLCLDDIRAKQEIIKQDNLSIQYLRSLDASVVLAARAGFPDFERNDLDFLSTKTCIDLFEKKYGKSITGVANVDILSDIIENRAGNHTLIINRLGNMAKDYGWSIPALANRLKKKEFSFQKGVADDELLQQEINKLYQVNDELGVAEKNILEAFSIFPAIPLALDLCVEWLHEDAGVDEDSCLLMLNRLSERTWLEERADEKNTASFVMHQMVRTALQKQTTIEYPMHQVLVKKCRTCLSDSTKAYQLQNSSSLIPFAVSIFEGFHIESSSLALLSIHIGKYYYASAEYSAALKWFQQAIFICEKLFGEDHPLTAISYSNIALVYIMFGNYDSALKFLLKAQSVHEKDSMQDQQDMIVNYSNIACVYVYKGQDDLALEWYQKALLISEKVLGKENANTATLFNNIAGVYDNQGKYELALTWYLNSLELAKELFVNDHPSIATTCNNIARVYKNQGQYDLALEWYSKALDIFKSVFSENHPYLATIYNNIACVYDSQGQYDLALEWYQKALEIREKVLGPDHPDTAIAYNNIASVYGNQGQYDLALEWYQRALMICEKVLGKEHPDTATTYNNIAAVYDSQGQYDLALDWYQKALMIREKVLGKEHPNTATTYNNIASVYDNQGRNDLALEWYQKALSIVIKVLGENHPTTIIIEENIEYVRAKS